MNTEENKSCTYILRDSKTHCASSSKVAYETSPNSSSIRLKCDEDLLEMLVQLLTTTHEKPSKITHKDISTRHTKSEGRSLDHAVQESDIQYADMSEIGIFQNRLAHEMDSPKLQLNYAHHKNEEASLSTPSTVVKKQNKFDCTFIKRLDTFSSKPPHTLEWKFVVNKQYAPPDKTNRPAPNKVVNWHHLPCLNPPNFEEEPDSNILSTSNTKEPKAVQLKYVTSSKPIDPVYKLKQSRNIHSTQSKFFSLDLQEQHNKEISEEGTTLDNDRNLAEDCSKYSENAEMQFAEFFESKIDIIRNKLAIKPLLESDTALLPIDVARTEMIEKIIEKVAEKVLGITAQHFSCDSQLSMKHEIEMIEKMQESSRKAPVAATHLDSLIDKLNKLINEQQKLGVFLSSGENCDVPDKTVSQAADIFNTNEPDMLVAIKFENEKIPDKTPEKMQVIIEQNELSPPSIKGFDSATTITFECKHMFDCTINDWESNQRYQHMDMEGGFTTNREFSNNEGVDNVIDAGLSIPMCIQVVNKDDENKLKCGERTTVDYKKIQECFKTNRNQDLAVRNKITEGDISHKLDSEIGQTQNKINKGGISHQQDSEIGQHQNEQAIRLKQSVNENPPPSSQVKDQSCIGSKTLKLVTCHKLTSSTPYDKPSSVFKSSLRCAQFPPANDHSKYVLPHKGRSRSVPKRPRNKSLTTTKNSTRSTQCQQGTDILGRPQPLRDVRTMSYQHQLIISNRVCSDDTVSGNQELPDESANSHCQEQTESVDNNTEDRLKKPSRKSFIPVKINTKYELMHEEQRPIFLKKKNLSNLTHRRIRSASRKHSLRYVHETYNPGQVSPTTLQQGTVPKELRRWQSADAGSGNKLILGTKISIKSDSKDKLKAIEKNPLPKLSNERKARKGRPQMHDIGSMTSKMYQKKHALGHMSVKNIHDSEITEDATKSTHKTADAEIHESLDSSQSDQIPNNRGLQLSDCELNLATQRLNVLINKLAIQHIEAVIKQSSILRTHKRVNELVKKHINTLLNQLDNNIADKTINLVGKSNDVEPVQRVVTINQSGETKETANPIGHQPHKLSGPHVAQVGTSLPQQLTGSPESSNCSPATKQNSSTFRLQASSPDFIANRDSHGKENCILSIHENGQKICTSTEGEGSQICAFIGGKGSQICTSPGREGLKICSSTEGEGSQICAFIGGKGSQICISPGREGLKICSCTEGEGSQICAFIGGKGSQICTSPGRESLQICSFTEGKGSQICTSAGRKISQTCAFKEWKDSQICISIGREVSQICTTAGGEGSSIYTSTGGKGSPICTPKGGKGSPICSSTGGKGSPICTSTGGEGSEICTLTGGENSQICTSTGGEGSPICTSTGGKGPEICTPKGEKRSSICTPTGGKDSLICTPTGGKDSPICTPARGKGSPICTSTGAKGPKICTLKGGKTSPICTPKRGKGSPICTPTGGRDSQICTSTGGKSSKICTSTGGKGSKICTSTGGKSSQNCNTTGWEVSQICTPTGGEYSQICTSTTEKSSPICPCTRGDVSQICTPKKDEYSQICTSTGGEASQTCVSAGGKGSQICTCTRGKGSQICTCTRGKDSQISTSTRGKGSQICTSTGGKGSQICTPTTGKGSQICAPTEDGYLQICASTGGDASQTCVSAGGEGSQICTSTGDEYSQICTSMGGEGSQICASTGEKGSQICTPTEEKGCQICTSKKMENANACFSNRDKNSWTVCAKTEKEVKLNLDEPPKNMHNPFNNKLTDSETNVHIKHSVFQSCEIQRQICSSNQMNQYEDGIQNEDVPLDLSCKNRVPSLTTIFSDIPQAFANKATESTSFHGSAASFFPVQSSPLNLSTKLADEADKHMTIESIAASSNSDTSVHSQRFVNVRSHLAKSSSHSDLSRVGRAFSTDSCLSRAGHAFSTDSCLSRAGHAFSTDSCQKNVHLCSQDLQGSNSDNRQSISLACDTATRKSELAEIGSLDNSIQEWMQTNILKFRNICQRKNVIDDIESRKSKKADPIIAHPGDEIPNLENVAEIQTPVEASKHDGGQENVNQMFMSSQEFSHCESEPLDMSLQPNPQNLHFESASYEEDHFNISTEDNIQIKRSRQIKHSPKKHESEISPKYHSLCPVNKTTEMDIKTSSKDIAQLFNSTNEEHLPQLLYKHGLDIASINQEIQTALKAEEHLKSLILTLKYVSSIVKDKTVSSIVKEETVNSIVQEKTVNSIEKEKTVDSIMEDETMNPKVEKKTVNPIVKEKTVDSIMEDETVNSKVNIRENKQTNVEPAPNKKSAVMKKIHKHKPCNEHSLDAYIPYSNISPNVRDIVSKNSFQKNNPTDTIAVIPRWKSKEVISNFASQNSSLHSYEQATGTRKSRGRLGCNQSNMTQPLFLSPPAAVSGCTDDKESSDLFRTSYCSHSSSSITMSDSCSLVDLNRMSGMIWVHSELPERPVSDNDLVESTSCIESYHSCTSSFSP